MHPDEERLKKEKKISEKRRIKTYAKVEEALVSSVLWRGGSGGQCHITKRKDF